MKFLLAFEFKFSGIRQILSCFYSARSSLITVIASSLILAEWFYEWATLRLNDILVFILRLILMAFIIPSFRVLFVHSFIHAFDKRTLSV